MKYARMGESGLIVSRISFGAMTFTLGNKSMEAIYKVGEGLAREMVAACIDKGVNFFDTADAYAGGESEVLLGRVLKGRRDDVVLSTKIGFRSGESLTQAGLSRRHILWSTDRCLERLDTDRVDLLIVHTEDPTTPLEETLVALDKIVRAGKARYIGFSNWSAWKAAAAIEFQKQNGLARFVTGQLYYSLVGRDIENDLLPMMRHYGVGMMVWSPLAGGFLTGRYTPENIESEGGRLSTFEFIPVEKGRGFAVVAKLKEIADAHGCSVSQTAIAWLLSKPEATSVIVGASKMSHLEDNLAAVDVDLSTEEIEALDAILPAPEIYPNWFLEKTRDQAFRQALED